MRAKVSSGESPDPVLIAGHIGLTRFTETRDELCEEDALLESLEWVLVDAC